MESETRTATVIVGAGPAGLAVAACLRRAGVPFILLERSEHVAASWCRHYDRLHLHTAKTFSSLPFMPFPRSYPRYPSRQQMIDYLDIYARQWSLQPLCGEQVIQARYEQARWITSTQHNTYSSSSLVIATGGAGQPHSPQWQDQDQFRGPIQHSSVYKTGADYRGQNVLVVGLGNSGGEIAIDLWEHDARPTVAVRGPVNIFPRDVLGIPGIAIAIALARLPPRLADWIAAPIIRAIAGDMAPYGLRRAGIGPFEQMRTSARIPLIDVGTLKLIRAGHVAVRPGIQRFTEHGVVFEDGKHEPFDAVILATGYRPAIPDLGPRATDVIDTSGAPLRHGREAGIAGLYFCGFFVSPTGMLREIAREARRITQDIARRRAIVATP